MNENIQQIDVASRAKAITKTSIIGIIANIFLVIFKALAGLLSGSIAIVLDAVNNLTDAISSIVTILGVKLANRAPDDRHPYGHGRVEYFSAIIISIIILAAGITSIIESVKKIIHPEVSDYSVVTLIILVVAIATKIVLGLYVSKQGKKYYSDALEGSGKDALFDAIISCATLIGAIVTLIFHISIDGYVGAVISIFIIKAGIEMLMAPINQIIGLRPDGDLSKNIKKDVCSIPGVIGAYDLVLHNYGPNSSIGSVHVEIPDKISAREIHILTQEIQKLIHDKYQVMMTVGVYAVDTQDFSTNVQAHIKEDMLKFEGVKGCHGIFIDDEGKYISFDILIDFKIRDRDAFRQKLIDEVHEHFPDYEVKINFDQNFSD